jgi:hypothetical protein
VVGAAIMVVGTRSFPLGPSSGRSLCLFDLVSSLNAATCLAAIGLWGACVLASKAGDLATSAPARTMVLARVLDLNLRG